MALPLMRCTAPVRIGLLGTGRVAHIRAREVAAHPDARLSLVAGDGERARTLADTYGVSASSDPSAIWQNDSIDAVMVCTSNERHADYARRCLEAGKHVSVDYPLALSIRDARSLYELAAEAGRVLHTEHIDLLSPWFQTFLQNVHKVGELEAVTWTDMSARQPGGRDWIFDRTAGPSMLVHASVLSRLIWMAGPVESVKGYESLLPEPDGRRFRRRLTQWQLKFESGIPGQICDGIGLPAQGPASQLIAYGSEGILHADDRTRVTLSQGSEREELFIARREGLFTQDVADFLNQVLHGTASYVPAEHVLRVMHAASLGDEAAL